MQPLILETQKPKKSYSENEALRRAQQKYREKNKEKRREYARQYYKSSREIECDEVIKARQREQSKRHYQKVKMQRELHKQQKIDLRGANPREHDVCREEKQQELMKAVSCEASDSDLRERSLHEHYECSECEQYECSEAGSDKSTECENESEQARLERLSDKYVRVLIGAVDILIEQDNEARKHRPGSKEFNLCLAKSEYTLNNIRNNCGDAYAYLAVDKAVNVLGYKICLSYDSYQLYKKGREAIEMIELQYNNRC